MAYIYRRIIKQNMNDSVLGSTVVERAAQVIQNVMAPDDPNLLSYLTVLAPSDSARQYRSLAPYSRTGYDEIDDMAANSGLDYTAVGRAILLWGTKHQIGRLPEFRDADFGASPIVTEYGMEFANLYAVGDGNGVYGTATRGGIEVNGQQVSGNDPSYGLVEILSTTTSTDAAEDTGTYTQAGLAAAQQSFADFAERGISDRYTPPVVVRVPDNTTVNPDTVLSIQQLVPGVTIPLRSSGTLRPVRASQKLDSLQVVETKDTETISVTLSPFNSADEETTEEV
jgi:hypothetical protein